MTTGQIIFFWFVFSVAGAIVFLHADRNGSRHPTAWGISVVLAPITALIYVIHFRRTRRPPRF